MGGAPIPKEPANGEIGSVSVRSGRYSWVDTHFLAPYTTTLMAKTDLAGGPRAMREPRARRSWVYWTLATIVLLAGFADLARGGETLAPILLIIGYCVLVPLAILR